MEEEFGTSPIRFEEEEEEGWSSTSKQNTFGFISSDDIPKEKDPRALLKNNEAYNALLNSLAEERKMILGNDKFSVRQKKAMLDENRKTLVVANGGSIRKTDSVVYGILIFGGVVLITLSLLTVFAGLPSEVTLAFVGTVLGGTIATIAQKLGKL